MVEEALDSARTRNGTKHMLVRLDRIGGQLIQLEIEDTSKPAVQAERPFQGQELGSIQKFAELISGSVSLENEGMLVRIRFPFTQTAEEETSSLP